MGRMIIVDDEPMVCHSISHIVSELGMDWEVVATAGDGLEALEIMGAVPIDLVLADIRMPEMDGFVFLEEVHLRYPHVLALILSAHADFSYARKALQLGVLDYLLKPVDPCDIKDALSRAKQILNVETNGLPGQSFEKDQAVLRQRLVVEVLEGRAEPKRWVQQAKTLGLPSFYGQVLTISHEMDLTTPVFIKWLEDIPSLLTADLTAINVFWGHNQVSLVLLGSKAALAQPDRWDKIIQEILEGLKSLLPSIKGVGVGRRCQATKLMQSYLDSLAPGEAEFPPGETTVSMAAQEAVRTACRWIEQHYQEKITLANIAAQVYLHPRYFSTIFSKVRGQAFSEYLMEIRIGRARRLLMQSDASCQSVAEEVGYENAGWFSQAFKRLTGVSPSDYRRTRGR